mgnify:CR=1 FL=1
MNGNEISIKKAMEQIEVPAGRLDAIIEEAFLETAPPKIKKRFNWLLPAAAASVLAIGISTAALTASPALANYMAELPVIGNVFSIFAEEEEGLLQYERFSEEVGLSQTSNGITISIDQAVYDGTNVTFTYTVTAKEELDDSAHVTGIPHLLEADGPNASMTWEVIDGQIAGMNAITHVSKDTAQVNVLWEPESLATEEGEIKGDWKFAFAVDQLIKEPIPLDEKVTESGVTVHFTEVTFTGIAVNIAYQQLVDPALLEEWEHVEAELIAKDNLGHVYKVPYNGGTAYGGARTREDLFWTATMRGLDPTATSLTFYPIATLSRMIDGKDPASERIAFDALEIDIIEGTYQIVESSAVPELPEEEEE